MNRNRQKILLAFAAALALSGCGAAAEKAGGDRAAAAPSPDKQSPARPAEAAATPAAANVAADTTAAPVAAARQDGSQPAGSRGRGATPPAAMPTPAIGSGGNDLFLFTRARAAVNADPELRAANLILEVKEGVLTLSGTVASDAHKSKAEQLVKESGVKTVKNQLRVSARSSE